MSVLRKPAVSGQFYPARVKGLTEIIDRFKPKESSKISAKGIIVPHAGYVYSGEVAVTTVSQVLAKPRLILLGPNHTGLGEPFALWTKGKWQIPFADIDIDEELAVKILERKGVIEEDEVAHKYEHSLEVQLPILYRFFGQFKFVPIACQQATLEIYQKVADQIIEAISDIKNDILFVASTDLTHYEPDASARAKDRIAIEAIVNLDQAGLINQVKKNNITMCGLAPVAILIGCMKSLSATKAQVSLYQTSGDSSGDYTSVVGYLGMVIK